MPRATSLGAPRAERARVLVDCAAASNGGSFVENRPNACGRDDAAAARGGERAQHRLELVDRRRAAALGSKSPRKWSTCTTALGMTTPAATRGGELVGARHEHAVAAARQLDAVEADRLRERELLDEGVALARGLLGCETEGHQATAPLGLSTTCSTSVVAVSTQLERLAALLERRTRARSSSVDASPCPRLGELDDGRLQAVLVPAVVERRVRRPRSARTRAGRGCGGTPRRAAGPCPSPCMNPATQTREL